MYLMPSKQVNRSDDGHNDLGREHRVLRSELLCVAHQDVPFWEWETMETNASSKWLKMQFMWPGFSPLPPLR